MYAVPFLAFSPSGSASHFKFYPHTHSLRMRIFFLHFRFEGYIEGFPTTLSDYSRKSENVEKSHSFVSHPFLITKSLQQLNLIYFI